MLKMDDPLLARAHDALDIGHHHATRSSIHGNMTPNGLGVTKHLQQYHHPGSLYIAAIIMETFLPNDELVHPLFGVLEQFVHSALSLFTSVMIESEACS